MDDNKKEPMTFEELSMSNMFQLEALYRLMVKKGMITEEEFINEWKLIKKEYEKANK